MNFQKEKGATTSLSKEIELSELVSFHNCPYKVNNDIEMNILKKSIAEFGVLVPVLARPNPYDKGYELISGHRRCVACQSLGINKIPAIVFGNLTEEESIIMMVDSNLQREHILPSEKAFAYKMKMEAISHRGKTYGQTGHKSREKIAENESGRTVQRYIRLTYLIPELLNWMDKDKMAFSVGVELSFLDKYWQQMVLDVCEENDCTPSYSQSWHLHQHAKKDTLNRKIIEQILSTEKPNQRETLKIPMDRLLNFLPESLSTNEQVEYILRAIQFYKAQHHSHK